MNWLGGHNLDSLNLIDPGDSVTTELLLAEQVLELNNYTNPTLTRLRGGIVMDPRIDSSVNGSSFAIGIAAIWVGPTGGFTPAGAPDILSSEFISSDRILATYLHGFGQNTYIKESGSSDTDLAVAAAQMIANCNVDVKAQRKLRDDEKIWLTVGCQGVGTGVVGLSWGYYIRALIKE